MPEFVASGTVAIKGCANPNTINRFYTTLYSTGTYYYVLKKAQIGVLEKVMIKRINLVRYDGLLPVFNYVDTMNEIWIEPELTSKDNAIAIAEAYIQTQSSQIECF